MKHLISFIFLVSFSQFILAQNTVESQHTADYYVKNVLLGQNVVVGKVTQVGQPASFGQFLCDSSITGISKGMILSTGKVNGIFQPNSTTEYTSYGAVPDRMNPVKGDSELDKLANGKSQDAVIIEFDFVPAKNVIEFKYVFASEEFIEYVGSEFNDVFGFFLSGPGIVGNKNLAVLNDGKTPISVNTINHRKNPEFFRDNTYENSVLSRTKKGVVISQLYQSLEFDGLTTVLVAQSEVEPFKVYHLKIALADVADEFLDSGVFLEATSFSSVEEPGGKYFDQIAQYDDNEPNIDSLLYGNSPNTNPAVEHKSEEQKFKVTNIYFDFNSTSLDIEGKQQLDLLAAYLKKSSTKRCSLIGYTDNKGTQIYNQKLSEDRAKQVIAYLISQGVPTENLSWSGKSFANPIENNTSEEGRAQNRRVEIVLED